MEEQFIPLIIWLTGRCRVGGCAARSGAVQGQRRRGPESLASTTSTTSTRRGSVA